LGRTNVIRIGNST